MSGFVSFVGAGPGDPELLTLKAADRLKRADAVLFDDLSSGPVLEHARPGADLVGVGKRAERISPRQRRVNQLPIDYALADPPACTVVFMGKRTFPELLPAPCARGLPPDTPAILAEAVSTPDQVLRRTTVTELARYLTAETGNNPALIFYGPLAEVGVGFD